MENDRFLTRKEAAEKYRCHETTIYRWRKLGMIRAFAIGGKVLYRQSDLDKIVHEL